MQPTPYVPQYTFPQLPQAATEFDNLALTIGEILANLAVIQRDDTGLNDEIVTTESLSPNVRALFGTGGTPRGVWITATSYSVRDVVETGVPLTAYMCVVAHTSGASFATDRAAGKWMILTSDSLASGVFPSITTNQLNGPASGNLFINAPGGGGGIGFVQWGGNDRWRWDNAQLAPTSDLGYNLGAPSLRWSTLYAAIVDSGTTGALTLRTNNGETGLRIDRTASSVNFLAVVPNIATGGPLLLATGADAAVTMNFSVKGAGNFAFNTNAESSSEVQLQVLRTASATRNITITGSNGGNPVIDVTAGALKLSGGTADIQWGKANVALGPGAAATLGTIGSTGPAAAGQRNWLRFLESDGTASFIPVWR